MARKKKKKTTTRSARAVKHPAAKPATRVLRSMPATHPDKKNVPPIS